MTTRARYRSRASRLSRPDTAAQLVADIINQKVEAKRRAEEAARMAVVRRRPRGRAWDFLLAMHL